MKIKLFDKILQIDIKIYKDTYTLAKNIMSYYLDHKQLSNTPKIALIKSARVLDDNLGLKEAKELIEELFVFSDDSISFKISE